MFRGPLLRLWWGLEWKSPFGSFDEAIDFLRQKFSAGQGSFLVILMGKDGEEKMRRQKVSLAEIFAVIDGMPMRQREMKERGKNRP